jgi:uncharacterized membrane protein
MHEEKSHWTWLGGLAAGAGMMYYLDPDRGRRRRALARDKCFSLFCQSGRAMDATARNLRAEGIGLVARMRSRMRHEDQASDEKLVARVRSEMGRAVSHPHAIDVMAQHGRVVLHGPVLREEYDGLISRIARVRGVKSVDAHLEAHEEPGNVPGLQGPRRRSQISALARENWPPALRLAAAAGGATLAISGTQRGGATGALAITAGAALLLRAATNMETRRLTGVGAGHRAVDIHKTVHIAAPVEEVFAFWDRVENFPRFMSRLKEVRRNGDGRTHWVACGPAGLTVEWDARETRREPNRLLAWSSEPGAAVQSAGMVHFAPHPHGGTQIDVQMSYNPPAGAIGHAFAAIFGLDPKSAMDGDLVRLKSLLEKGKATAHHHTVYRDQLPSGAQA